jgi:hypothetical protein
MNPNRRLLLAVSLALMVLWAVPLFAQDVATPAGTAPTAPVSTTDLQKSISIAGMASVLMQYLKNTKWFPLLSDKSSRGFKIATAAIVAAITTLGITWTHPDAHSLLITWPGWGVMAGNLYHFGQQWLFQEAWYQKLVRNGTAAASGG